MMSSPEESLFVVVGSDGMCICVCDHASTAAASGFISLYVDEEPPEKVFFTVWRCAKRSYNRSARYDKYRVKVEGGKPYVLRKEAKASAPAIIRTMLHEES
tara:strand:- start:607 stop:909 length:303 start_codon:yes stop_codon:yes gene_type:complete